MYEHDHSVYCLAVSPDGTMIASACQKGTLKLYDTLTHQQLGEVQNAHDNHDEYSSITCLAFSSDNTMLMSGGFIVSDRGRYQGAVCIWSVAISSQPPIQTLPLLRTMFHGESLSVLSIAMHPDGCTLASGAHDDYSRIWSIKDGSCQHMLETCANNYVCAFTFIKNNNHHLCNNNHNDDDDDVDDNGG